eukprot:10534068-Alexandrium_andersonii.AAC.1
MSPASAVMYEEEQLEWPTCFSPQLDKVKGASGEALEAGLDGDPDLDEREPWPECFSPELLDPKIEPITPNTGKRKRQA